MHGHVRDTANRHEQALRVAVHWVDQTESGLSRVKVRRPLPEGAEIRGVDESIVCFSPLL